MPTIIGIIFIVVVVALFENTPDHVWVGVLIVGSGIALFVAAWFALAYLLRAFLKIATNFKD